MYVCMYVYELHVDTYPPHIYRYIFYFIFIRILKFWPCEPPQKNDPPQKNKKQKRMIQFANKKILHKLIFWGQNSMNKKTAKNIRTAWK